MSARWTDLARSVVQLRCGGRTGTGWVALANGLIVTNVHVVGYQSTVTVRSSRGVEVPARVVHADTRLDIAFVMPTEPMELTPLELARSEQATPGQPVVAIGHPMGLSFTITQGVLSAVNRVFRGVAWLQTDTAINPGNSGGPLLDAEGRVVGVNTRIHGEGQNLAFAVPVHLFEPDLRSFVGPPQHVLAQEPDYRCPACDERYTQSDERCLRCGLPLPYTDAPGLLTLSHAWVRAERAVTGMIARLGTQPHEVWVSRGRWRLPQRSGHVWILLDDRGHYVDFVAPLVKVPGDRHEAFFRFLLTLNDRTTDVCRLSLAGDVVILSASEPTLFLNASEATNGLKVLLLLAEDLRDVLVRGYGAEPAREAEMGAL